MRIPATLALAAVSLSACTAGPERLVEQGYTRGALAVAAIDRKDWAAAEQALTSRHDVAADDPARLINLGKVYMETGRSGAAMSAWRLALASPSHFMVETGDGRWVSTRDLAQQALATYGQDVRSASR